VSAALAFAAVRAWEGAASSTNLMTGWTVEYHHVANGIAHSSVECVSPVVDAKRRAIYCPAEDWDAQGFTPKEVAP
jgi:hypothetical protein